MFVLKNAWATLTRHGWRTGIIVVTAMVVVGTTILSTAVISADDTATGSTYDSQEPTAVIRPTAATMAKRNGADPNWTKNHLSWEDYTTYASAVQKANISFSYTFSETVPVRQTSSLKAIGGASDASADKTGGQLTWRSFYTLQAAQASDIGRFRLVSGKHLNYTGTDKSSVLISKALAKKNGLKVGDTIKVANPTNASKTYTLKIRGIYEYVSTAAAGKGSDAKLAKDNRDNAIYTAYYTFAINGLDTSSGKGWAIPDLNITFKLTSLKAYNKFVKTVKKAKLPSKYEVSSPSLTAYEEKIAPLTSLANVLRVLRIVVWAAGGVLLVVLVVLGLRRRRNEIGVAMVVGASRGRIAWQFMIEVLLPTLVGLTLGMFAGGFGSGPLGHALTGNSTPVGARLVWSMIGYGFAACLALSFIAMGRVVAFRKAGLFVTASEEALQPVASDENADMIETAETTASTTGSGGPDAGTDADDDDSDDADGKDTR